MMLYELERLEDGLFFCLFDTPDRVQHMFWRFGENGHPAKQGAATSELAHAIEDHYRACDAIMGKALQYADDQTLFIVLSDHGMNSFQRGVHLNTWLHDNGLLSLRNGVKPGKEAADFFRSVDWGRTKAYALGMGGIYLNLKGREEQGIVEASEADAVKVAIVKGLTGLHDPVRGGWPSAVSSRGNKLCRGRMRTSRPICWSTSPKDTAFPGPRRWGVCLKDTSRTM